MKKPLPKVTVSGKAKEMSDILNSHKPTQAEFDFALNAVIYPMTQLSMMNAEEAKTNLWRLLFNAVCTGISYGRLTLKQRAKVDAFIKESNRVLQDESSPNSDKPRHEA